MQLPGVAAFGLADAQSASLRHYEPEAAGSPPTWPCIWHGWMQSQPYRRLKNSVETADDRSPLSLHIGGIDDSVLGMVGQW